MERLEAMIGRSERVIEDLEIEAGKVEEFARAVGDDNPAHRDASAARNQGFEAIPAPLTFTRVGYFPRYRPDGVDDLRPFDLGFAPDRRLHGEQAYEFERPVRVGDVLSATITLTDVYQREGTGGTLTFAEFELEYVDADGEPVLTERNSVIEAPSPAEVTE
jgi:acyl dehydratase